MRLRGEVRTSPTHGNLVDGVRRVASVLSVTDELVEDQELELAVAAALAGAPVTRTLDMYVFARRPHIGVAPIEVTTRRLAERDEAGTSGWSSTAVVHRVDGFHRIVNNDSLSLSTVRCPRWT